MDLKGELDELIKRSCGVVSHFYLLSLHFACALRMR